MSIVEIETYTSIEWDWDTQRTDWEGLIWTGQTEKTCGTVHQQSCILSAYQTSIQSQVRQRRCRQHYTTRCSMGINCDISISGSHRHLSWNNWVRDFAYGILRLCISHCARCTISKVPHPNKRTTVTLDVFRWRTMLTGKSFNGNQLRNVHVS